MKKANVAVLVAAIFVSGLAFGSVKVHKYRTTNQHFSAVQLCNESPEDGESVFDADSSCPAATSSYNL
jgi:hypothetical protein